MALPALHEARNCLACLGRCCGGAKDKEVALSGSWVWTATFGATQLLVSRLAKVSYLGASGPVVVSALLACRPAGKSP
jgi:hypothetical protein